ncbi:MAG: cardiolipin synthase [Spirochaetaceae bacterium]|jgi:cardiolipin synthase|nr:cardiolipin synthase [Spirochaetaceae bacterium]
MADVRNVSKNVPKWMHIVFRRRMFVILTLLAQLVLLFFIIFNTSKTFTIINTLLTAISIVVSFLILNRREKPDFKIVWVFLILLFPLFGGAMYLFFYLISDSKSLRQRIESCKNYVRPWFKYKIQRDDSIPDIAQIRYIEDYAGYPVYLHSKTNYYSDIRDFQKDLLEDLRKAEKYIFMEFFILRPGKMLNPILAIMEEKAKAGLDVRLSYDDMGCLLSLPTHFDKYLEKRGIKCTKFSPFRPILSSQQNNRDHRKIVSIDGKIAYTGGMNLADEYINAIERFGYWKDSAIRVEGDAAWSLTLIFLSLWNIRKKKDKREKDDIAAFYPESAYREYANTGDGFVQPYADSPLDQDNVGEHVYLHIINSAQNYLYINTPYLVVDYNIVSTLTLAAKSGVDVKIITPYRWDKWFVRIVSRSYYRQLIRAGVEVYEYKPGFNHSKTFVSDDKVATVGTVNLDYRSLYHHFECGVVLFKNSSVAAVKKDFLENLAVCKKIEEADCQRNVAQRLFQDLLRIFAPLM